MSELCVEKISLQSAAIGFEVLLPRISISEILDGEPCPFTFQAGILDHV
jgi:hypothetical protein